MDQPEPAEPQETAGDPAAPEETAAEPAEPRNTASERAETATAVPVGEQGEKSASPADEVRRALRAARERSQEQEPPAQGLARGASHGPSHESAVRPGRPASRPGDAARAALRRTADPAPAVTATVTESTPGEAAPVADADPTATAAPSAGAAPTDPASADLRQADLPPADLPPEAPSSTDAPPTVGEPRAPRADTGSRPGDLAREALRAARAQARQSPAETRTRSGRGTPRGDGGLRPRTGARPAETRRHRSPQDQVADERARVVRELLAGAFRMPSEETARPEDGIAPETEPEAAPGAEPGAEPEAEPGAGRTEPEAAPEAAFEPEPETAPGAASEAWPGAATEPEAVVGNGAAAEGSSPAGGPPTGASSAASLAVAGASSRSPGPSRAPRSMAAPARDGDHRRTFPAFPPRTGGSFAGTWWGNAWVAALEEGALDAQRLARGRGYAEQGNVDAITVTPGLVLAYVQGSRPRPYRVQVRLRTLGGEDWERFLEAAVERPGHIAALLDKEMPESLAECGVPLLPGPGDLEPQCSCPDRGHPCKHAAALCYQTARLLDADPFVLLLLRGRGEREVLDALSRRNATRAARAAQEQEPEPLPGVRAAEALAERRLPPLPAPLPVPPHPEQPPAYPSAPNGPDSFALDHLATDAAARAHALLTTGHDEIGGLDLWRDAVRLAASRPGSGLTVTTRALYAALASAAGRTPVELARAVAAWRQGGPDGLTVLEETWDPPAGRFDRARPLLLAADLPAFRPRRNHLTHPRGHVQLRFGRDGLWYAYESEPGHDDWWPRGTPDPDPVGALTGLGASDEF
ncbi:SWIM zinc finger family protein [Streptomyces sp. NBC_00637]|uniref:SWIM zinc finger family protein n=1 Tax=Streptomyces sp. NBC_00637 TaxID=2903667 RepID=UPI00324D8171